MSKVPSREELEASHCVAARLASIAEAGELVCSEAVYVASGLTHPAERREVVLKGVSVAVPVRVLRVGYAELAAAPPAIVNVTSYGLIRAR